MTAPAQRLFVGLVALSKQTPGRIDIFNESFAGFYDNEAEARGDWVLRAQKAHPGLPMDEVMVNDITDFAREGLAK